MNLLVGLTYLFILIGVGLYSVRKTADAQDYYLAGRRLGLVTLVLATMASIMSGFVFVGGPGLFYEVGLGSFWITISSSFTGALMCWLLAKPLMHLSSASGCLTIPDVILERFGCRFASGCASVAIFVGVIGYLATQLLALGVLLNAMTPLGRGPALFVGLAVLVFYSAAGGMLASVYTDVVQGAIMLWVATLIFYFGLVGTGGPDAITLSFARAGSPDLTPWGEAGSLTCLGWFFLFSVGSLGQPHVVNRFMMVRDSGSLKFFPVLLAVSMMICGLVWLGAGAAVKSLVLSGGLPAPLHADDTVSLFLTRLAPRWLLPFAYVGIVAAIMSTADSFVNVGAAAVSRDLARALGLRLERQVFWGRWCSLLIFALAGILALGSRTLVAYLGILAFSSFAAALTPALAIGLNWQEAGPWAARLSILTGLTLSGALELWSRLGDQSFPVPPGLLALGFSLLVFLIVGKVGEKAKPVRPTGIPASAG